jgi:hypothetical protein
MGKAFSVGTAKVYPQALQGLAKQAAFNAETRSATVSEVHPQFSPLDRVIPGGVM